MCKIPSPTNYLLWQIPALKSLCKDRGIPRSATKPILVKRLREWESKNNTLKLIPRTPKRPRPESDNEDDDYEKGGGHSPQWNPQKAKKIDHISKDETEKHEGCYEC